MRARHSGDVDDLERKPVETKETPGEGEYEKAELRVALVVPVEVFVAVAQVHVAFRVLE